MPARELLEIYGQGNASMREKLELIVDGPEVIRMMRAAIEHDPRYADLPYGATIMFAYIHHFPCPWMGPN